MELGYSALPMRAHAFLPLVYWEEEGNLLLLGLPVWNQILQSSRVAVGGGVSVGSPMGRFEATYVVPMRYGPRDARKSVQFGFGFSFG